MKNAAKILREKMLNESSRTERLHSLSFEDNDNYKVCYRFISNMLTQWKDLGLKRFPTQEDAEKIAKLSHPYFKWLFKDKNELDAFRATYQFHADVWSEVKI